MKFEKFKPENYKNVNTKFTLRLPEEMHEEIAKYSQRHHIFYLAGKFYYKN